MLPRKENIIAVKTDAFGNRVLRLYKYLTEVKSEYVLSKQILRSGTSIGANVAESRNAQGSRDFVSKLSIALKEADETAYWLRMLQAGEYITAVQFESMSHDNEEIIKILTKIIKSIKEKLNA